MSLKKKLEQKIRSIQKTASADSKDLPDPYHIYIFLFQYTRVADLHHFNADPDQGFHFNADPHPDFPFNADPDTVPHQNYANLQPLDHRSSRAFFEPPGINFERLRHSTAPF